MAATALSQITKLEAIKQNVDGTYSKSVDLNAIASLVRSVKTLSDNTTAALTEFDLFDLDDDARLIITVKGVDVPVQMDFTAAFKSALATIKTALDDANTTVGSVTLPLP